MEINDLDYFKQKIYEISRVPKSSLEKIDEEPLSQDEVRLEHRFEKFIGYLSKQNLIKVYNYKIKIIKISWQFIKVSL